MRKYHYVKPHVVENIIGIKMPKYKVVKRELGYIENVTMHKDIFTLEFNIIPDKSFYQDLQHKGFDYQDGCYSIKLFCCSGWKKELRPGEYSNYFAYHMKICEGEQTFTIKIVKHEP